MIEILPKDLVSMRDGFKAALTERDDAAKKGETPLHIEGFIKGKEDLYNTPEDSSLKVLNELVDLESRVRTKLEAGYILLSRFCVMDGNEMKAKEKGGHPGFNSWYYFAQQTNQKVSVIKEPKKVAKLHMEAGHDAGGESMEWSPFVSTTRSLRDLLMADSYYITGKRWQLAMGSGHTPGMIWSENIAMLLYGATSVKMTVYKPHVADTLAFLVVPTSELKKKVFFPTHVDLKDKSLCCNLECEVAVFAPDFSLTDLMLGSVKNPLSALKNVKIIEDSKLFVSSSQSQQVSTGMISSKGMGSVSTPKVESNKDNK